MPMNSDSALSSSCSSLGKRVRSVVYIFSAFQCIAYICRAVSSIFFFHSTVAILGKTVTQTWPYVLRGGVATHSSIYYWVKGKIFSWSNGQRLKYTMHIRVNLRSSPVFKRQK